jgi:hypothetical protein
MGGTLITFCVGDQGDHPDHLIRLNALPAGVRLQLAGRGRSGRLLAESSAPSALPNADLQSPLLGPWRMLPPPEKVGSAVVGLAPAACR